MNDLKLQLPVFEGPLDLLLHLVKINEMDVHDLQISEITAQYLACLRLMEALDLEIAGDYLVMAATLLNIKLRSLLPASEEEAGEEEEVEDILTARMLMERLVEYRKFKEAAAVLRDEQRRRADQFVREAAIPRLARRAADAELQVSLDQLLVAFRRVLRFVQAEGWSLVTAEEFTVEEKIAEIEELLASAGRVDVEALFGRSRSKIELIVYLLAALELCHLRRVAIDQTAAFGAIYLRPLRPEAAQAPPSPSGDRP